MYSSPFSSRVGIASCDVTPPVGVYLAGYANRTQPSTGVYHALKAVAVYVECGEACWLLLSAEWLGFYEHTASMRERIEAAAGIPGRCVMLTGTHTHCGPALREMDRVRHGGIDQAPVGLEVDRMARCAAGARAAAAPARLRLGVGVCRFAVSRRRPDGRGGVTWQPWAGGPCDHDVPVLTVESPGGGVRGVVFGYACHPTSRAGTLIGGDYPTFAADHLEDALPGATAAFIQGCGGDQKPHPVDPGADAFDQRTVEQVRALGEQLGDAALAVVDADDGFDVTGPLTVARTEMTLRTEPTDPVEVQRCRDSRLPHERAWAAHMLAAGPSAPRDVPFEIQVVRFGRSLAIVSLSGEMTAEYALNVRRALKGRFEYVWPIGYTNHGIGYVPVARQIPEGVYEVTGSNQHMLRTGPYVAETEGRILAAIQGLLAD